MPGRRPGGPVTGPSGPRRLVLVTGTATEVGKTWVAAALLSRARERGLVVAARKPAQSFEVTPGPGPGGPLPVEPTDAQRLAASTGEDPGLVCPAGHSYAVPMAPPMAAAALGRPAPTIEDYVRTIEGSWAPGEGAPERIDLAVVEGAGGVASPLGDDGDSADLGRALGAHVAVVVAVPSLGVINSVRLAVAALDPIPVIVHLNRFDAGDDMHWRNLEWLRGRDGLTVTTGIDDLLEALAGT